MSSPHLFTPLRVRNLQLANRIVIAPMCQYSAVDGCMTDWHAMHLGGLAQSGAGVLTIEATAVVPEGRISDRDVGLYNDANEAAIARTLAGIRAWSDMPIAIQLSHAGRKASGDVPWQGQKQFAPSHERGWQTEGPSDVPYAPGQVPPVALDREGMVRVRQAFVSAARRAYRLGLDAVQLHMAHGYLLHSFLSPLSNHRSDAYGGSLENRARFPLEVLDAVRDVFPDRAVTVRISATDWVQGGLTLDETVELSRMLERHGADAINVSTGGLHPDQQIPVSPGYQVPHAAAVKAAVSIPVVAVGLITEPAHAEAIVANGDADLIGLARAVLYDPRWPWHAAAALEGQAKVAPQYVRSIPHRFKASLA